MTGRVVKKTRLTSCPFQSIPAGETPQANVRTPSSTSRMCGKASPWPTAVVRIFSRSRAALTTAVGHGLAFPHMRGVEEGVLTFACGVSPAGIDWNGQLVHLVFFTTLPVIASPFYLKLIAAICKTFEDDEKLPFVLAAGDAKTLWKELNKATRVPVKNM